MQDVAPAAQLADRFPLEMTHVSRWEETMGGTRKGVARVADVSTRQLLFVLSSRRASCVSEAIGGLMFNTCVVAQNIG